MLSYQHEYHAGNHGDILKHICIISILESLCKKEKPFTVVDTHSGAGRFSLEDDRLKKTGEAENGVIRLMDSIKRFDSVPESVQKYIDFENPYLDNNLYAGSPEIERSFLRKGDVGHFIEMHPTALASLEKNINLPLLDGSEKKMSGKAVIHKGDSYRTVAGLVPPLVKRGLVLCDPSYEDCSDYYQVVDTLKIVHKKWNTAIIALWYPILERKKNETSQMLCELEDFAKLGLNPCETKKFELTIYDPENIPKEMSREDGSHMIGSGMFIINPPWQLDEKMNESVEFLNKVFRQT